MMGGLSMYSFTKDCISINECIGVRTTIHGLKRWNDRITEQEIYKTNREFEIYLNNCFKNNSIIHLYNDFFLIDNDIVGIFHQEGSYLKLITVYGRRSNNPLLYDMKSFAKNRKKYGKMKINLFCIN